MGKIKLQKKEYDKFVFKGLLAVECYDDANDIDDDKKTAIKKIYKKGNEYHELNRQLIKSRDTLVEDLLNLIEMLGEEKFTIYDDGDITYNDKN